MIQEMTSSRLNEKYYKIEHPSGLTVLLYPMKGFSSAYALYGTRYGSIDTTFRSNDKEDFITVARNGKPVVKITLINEVPVSKRIGVARGKFSMKGDFDADNGEIADMLMGGTL